MNRNTTIKATDALSATLDTLARHPEFTTFDRIRLSVDNAQAIGLIQLSRQVRQELIQNIFLALKETV